MRLLRDLIKMNGPNNGTRSLLESIAIPEVEQALTDWQRAYQGQCVLIGGTAVGYYTKPRATTDLDFLFITNQDIPSSIMGFKRVRPSAFQHNKTHVEVELVTPQLIHIPLELAEMVFKTAIKSNGLLIASPSALVALKLQRMKRYDEGDIWGLIETGKVNLSGWPITPEQQTIYQNILNKVNQK